MKKSIFLFLFLIHTVLLFSQIGFEQYRPKFHFSPKTNWLNDPNGLVYFDGEYHLFYQYNPYGNQWGNMSWGHAVSTDLLKWEHLDIAIPMTGNVMAFSGSAVIDWHNSSGFGINGAPPMVALYTATDGNQRQNIAYSNNKGRTWNFYSGNPVLNLFDDDFRDPKVIFHEPTSQWIMVVALANRQRVRFYGSQNLKNWYFLQDFGNVGDLSGAWECPDLFPLPVDGNADSVKWVLQVDVAPGKPQYFTGDFDGFSFKADKYPEENIDHLPQGSVLNAFDDNTFGNWTVSGTAFGSSPTSGNLPNQLPVAGFLGDGFANSYHGGDQSIGAMTSPVFLITHNYINFKIGGGNHPEHAYVRLIINNEVVFSETGKDDEFLEWKSWNVEAYSGQSAIIQIADSVSTGWGHILADHFFLSDTSLLEILPPSGKIIEDFEDFQYTRWAVAGSAFGNGPAQGTLPGQQEVKGYIGKGLVNSFHGGDISQGKMTSDIFTIDSTYISFLIGGGNHPDGVFIRLRVNNSTVAQSTGKNSETLMWDFWDVEQYAGQDAVIEIVDSVTGGWGHINIDHIIQTNQPKQNPFYDMVDYGMDFYAAQSFSDIPAEDGRRIWLAWMNNWSYAGEVPTSPWRGIMSVPREVGLTVFNNELKLFQLPVTELESLRDSLIEFNNLPVLEAKPVFDKIEFPVFEIKTIIDLRGANRIDFKLRKGSNQETLLSYDAIEQRLIFDRSKSGALTNNASFAQVQSAPLPLENGKIQLQILVDQSSIEVFCNNGKVVMSNQIFPDSTSIGMEIFSDNDNAFIENLSLWKLNPADPNLSAEEISSANPDHITAFPNPAINQDVALKLPSGNYNEIKVKLYNSEGRLVGQLVPFEQSETIIIPKTMFERAGLYVAAVYINNIQYLKKISILK
jgi:fructan beta-fructosidase